MASLDFEAEKAAFREYYSLHQKTLFDAEVFFRSLVGGLLSNHSKINHPTVISRVKDREEAIKKFVRKYQSDLEAAKLPYEIRDHITDLIGVRVVSLYEDEVDHIGEIVAQNFEVLEVTDKIKELESTEDEFGYKGLHMDLKINSTRRKLPEYAPFVGLRFELQIRTIIQDAWSVLDHKIKYKKSIPPALKRRINALAAQFETVDHEFLAIRNESQKLEQSTTINTKAKNAAELDAFEFLAVGRQCFPGYTFYSEYVDGFVQEILNRAPGYSGVELKEAIAKLKDRVERYKRDAVLPMNPFTIVRHILFLSDREKFNFILFDKQRANFVAWLHHDKPPS